LIIDSEEQRQLILACILATNWPGNAIEQGYELKRAVIDAAVKDPKEAQ